MNFSAHDFVTPDEILANALRIVQDEDYRLHTPGYYTSQMQFALQELAFDTFFDFKTKSLPITKNLRIPLPEGSFNIRNIWLYNGDDCNVNRSANVYWKRNFERSGTGYFANDKVQNINDPFAKQRVGTLDPHNMKTYEENSDPNNPAFANGGASIRGVLFFNVQNGMIMLSDSCAKYQNIHIQYNGMGCRIGDKPVIPAYLRRAVELFTIERALLTRIAKADSAFEMSKWQSLYNIHHKELKGSTDGKFDGAWFDAEMRVKSMDSKSRSDLKNYLNKLDKQK